MTIFDNDYIVGLLGFVTSTQPTALTHLKRWVTADS